MSRLFLKFIVFFFLIKNRPVSLFFTNLIVYDIIMHVSKDRYYRRGEIMLEEGERLEPLGNGIRVIVSDEHGFGTDTVLLANFSMPKSSDKACELGTGCGTIPLIWSREGKPHSVTAVDIQEKACSMLKRSAELNGLDKKITVLHSDILELSGKVEYSSYDLVVCNPPYKAAGTGIVNPVQSQMIARHECTCTVEDIIRVASRLLRFSGRLCMCQRPERLSDLICTMRRYNIEPKRLRFVQQRASKQPKLFLIEGRRSGKPLSEEMIQIYGAYKEEYL